MGTLGEGAGVSGGNDGGGQGSSGGGTPPPAVGAGGNSAGAAAGDGGGNGGGTPPAVGQGAAGDTARWQDGLPDDLKADATLGKYSDVTNLAKAHIELQKKFGQKGIFKPEPGASPERIKQFREELGIPTDPAKYDMGKIEGVAVPPETVSWAQKLGAEHGVEPAAMKTLLTEYFKLDAAVKQKADQDIQAGIKTAYDGLRAKWGDAFDRNLKRAQYAADKLGGAEFVSSLAKYKANNDVVIIETLARAAELLGEDSLREAGAGDGRETPQELEIQIKQVFDQMQSAPKGSATYQSLSARYASLWKMKTGGR